MPAADEIVVGTLYSLHGPMSASERLVLEALEMAFEEINLGGGILGRKICVVREDGRSDPTVFARKAEKLLAEDRVSAIFGCWTSSSRKSVKPVIEKYNSLLWYPIQYEGLEQSRNILYTGACLNQQVVPAVEWALKQGARNVFLVGSDYVFPRTANHMIRTLVEEGGGRIAGEKLVSMGEQNFDALFAGLKDQGVDLIFNTINGESNAAFFRAYASSGLNPASLPVLSFSFSEIELAHVRREAEGHYACWGYFKGSNSLENAIFLQRYRQRYGNASQVSDPVVTAYTQVMLWKHIIESCGSSDPQDVLAHAAHAGVNGPGGRMEIQANNHVRRPALIGQANQAGSFEIVWESQEQIDPKPWLGMEDVQIANQRMVLDALASYPEVIHLNWSMQQEIARREQAEARLRQQSQELERAREAAEAASQAKNIFLANMGHELRTPLTGILGLAEVLDLELNGPMNDDQLRAVRGIQTSGNRLLKMINRVIEYVQLLSPQVSLEPENCFLYLLFEECITRVRGLPAAHGHRLEFRVAPPDMHVRVDKKLMEAALMELLENAVKFMHEPGEIRLTALGDEENREVRISISDTGIGIPAEHLPQLFTAFVQLDAGLDRAYEGAGLGLALVKRIVTLHEGSIEAASEPGEGSVFTITLPWRPTLDR